MSYTCNTSLIRDSNRNLCYSCRAMADVPRINLCRFLCLCLIFATILIWLVPTWKFLQLHRFEKSHERKLRWIILAWFHLLISMMSLAIPSCAATTEMEEVVKFYGRFWILFCQAMGSYAAIGCCGRLLGTCQISFRSSSTWRVPSLLDSSRLSTWYTSPLRCLGPTRSTIHEYYEWKDESWMESLSRQRRSAYNSTSL